MPTPEDSPNQDLLQRQLTVLQRVDGFMGTIDDLDQLLEQIMQESQQVTEAEASSLALLNEKADEFIFHVVLGDKGAETKNETVKSNEGIIGWVAETGKSRNIKDAYADEHFTSRLDLKTGFRTRSILAVPMLRRGCLIGVIEVLNKKQAEGFTEEDQSILEILAHQAAIAIESARLYQKSLEKEHLASLGQGISGAAHCIKNIISIIDLGSSSVEMGLERKNIDLIQSAWGPLQQGCERISGLVMDMLSYAKDRTPELVSVNLNQVLESIVQMARPVCASRGISLEQALDPSIGSRELDYNGIHRCIMNLISNAQDACEKKGSTITVVSRLDEPTGNAVIEISDTGSGIPGDKLETIFDVFYSTKGSKGTGLGLCTTKKIINEHGGTLSVTSAEGEGTTFSISLPQKTPEKQTAKTHE